MADSKLQDLNSGVGVATLADANFFYAEQGTTAKFCTAAVMKTYMWLTPTLGGHVDLGGFDLNNGGVMFLTEQAAADADVAGKGQFWVKTATPNQAWFTDDAGTDFQLANLAEAQTFTNKTLTAPTINGGDYNGVALTTEEGSGWAGVAAYSSEITKQGKIVKTHIFIDIAGLVVSTTLLDIIGDSAAANSHAGQILTAECGVPIRGTITCLEAPTTGVADIDFYASSAATGAENADVSALADPVVLLANTEAWTLGMTKALALVPDATSDYLYLAAGDAGTPGTYGAGQFLIEIESYEA